MFFSINTLWKSLIGEIFLILLFLQPNCALLYPRESETREMRSLDGIWRFIRSTDLLDCPNGIPKDLNFHDAIDMPVPSSYNDITQDKQLRDHVGIVWYRRNFYVPSSWCTNLEDMLIWLRFGSVHYSANVWVNGKWVMSHQIGHLPFQNNITKLLKIGEPNQIVVCVDNKLNRESIPQGRLSNATSDNGNVIVQTYEFDFFNYAGIHRPVVLYTTPTVYIEDISVQTLSVSNDEATLSYKIKIAESNKKIVKGYLCHVSLWDVDHNKVISKKSCQSQLKINNPKLWWPYLMDANPGYMYTLKVGLQLTTEFNEQKQGYNFIDIYRLPVGLRTIEWTNISLLINNKPVYLHGFGRHEDSDIRGKGLDLAIVTRDYSLIKWIGANAYRTSHYPYAEEIMDFADRHGIMTIDECSSVNTDDFSENLLENHKRALTELIVRDKNRPSVIMWSIANEARTDKNQSGTYFEIVANHVRLLDQTRPVTSSIFRPYDTDHIAEHLDIISFNRYNSWYINSGRTDMIQEAVETEANQWHSFGKPVLMSEYGGGTLAGMHGSPSYTFTEEYQVDLMSKHFKVFDKLRKEGFFIGEFIWNFADFNTPEGYTRPGGNKKGIFTRDRQPKASAHHLRRRYFQLAKSLNDKVVLPEDLIPYTTQ